MKGGWPEIKNCDDAGARVYVPHKDACIGMIDYEANEIVSHICKELAEHKVTREDRGSTFEMHVCRCGFQWMKAP